VGATRLTDQIYEVTGELSPDVTGTYNPIGTYNSKPSYEIVATGWFIWWDGIDSWKISTLRGTEGTNFWTRTDPAIVGQYDPTLPATGNAVVAELV